MTDHVAELRCPSCGALVEAAVAEGLCRACLLQQVALGTGTESGPSVAWRPPTVEELTAVFPQLEIVGLIGRGGMGAVYKARQKSLGRLVALKILAPHHAANPDFAERFAREAQALAEVNHPNIVTVYDSGRAGEFFFLTMEFVDGVNLRQAMSAGRLTPPQALAIVPPICEALQFAHEHGIVHRDIKPENLLLDKDGRIKIADFGIARMMRVGQAFQPDHLTSNASQAGKPDLQKPDLTQQSVLGTPQYMAPEQRDAPSAVDHRADIYSLGVVLYEMLTGELPGTNLVPPSKKVQIDVRLDEIVLRALEHEPELRFHTATEFRQQVEGVVNTPPPTSLGSGEPVTRSIPRPMRGHVTTPHELGWLPNLRSKSALPAFGLLAIAIALPLLFLGTQTVVGGSLSEHIWRTVWIIAVMWPVICVLSAACLVLSEVYNRIVQARIPGHAADNEHSGGASSDAGLSDSSAGEHSQPTTRLPMIANGIACTAERLATIWGRFFAHRDRAEFVLDENQLRIRWPVLFRSEESIVIPLKSIRDVEVGHYSTTVILMGLDYVRVTYESDGNTRQVCFTPFTPSASWLLSIPAANLHVVEWSEAIRAVTDGREPVITAKAARSPQPLAMIWSIPPWFLVFLTTLVGFAMSLKNASGMRTSAEAVLFVIGMTVLAFGWGWVMAWVISREGRRALAMRPQVRESEPPHGETSVVSAPAESSSPSPTNRRQLGGRRLFAVALALGFVVIGYLALLSGRAAQMLTSDLYLTLLMLFPFMIVGLVAGVASRRGTVVGLWALLTGVVVVAAIDSYGYLAVQEAMRKRAWTGAALTQGMFAIAAIPASLVGSFVGVAIGLFIVRFGKSRSNDQISPHGAEPLPDGPFVDERSQRHKIAIAASVVWLVTGMVVGTVKLKATEVRFRYDFEWLALTLFLLATAVLPGVLVSKSIKQWCEKRDLQDRPSIFGWLRATAVLGFAMTLPFVMFTTGLLDGLVSQALVWEGRTFAMLLPIGLIGFIALPWASVVLWQARFLLTGATGDSLVDDARRRQHRRVVIGTVLAMLVAVALVISVPTGPQTIEVTTRHAAVENGHFTFGYSVQNVPGWNVWLTLENAQLINSDSPHLEDHGPVVVSRYQTKLVGNGRVRVPLEYLPTTDEGRGKMLASIGPSEGDRAILQPRVQVSRLAFQTESLMRVWAMLMMLPEGQTPDSQLIEPTGSPAAPRYKTIEPPAQPKLAPFEGAYDQGRVEFVALRRHPANGQPSWKPNGDLLTETGLPDLGGSSSAGGKVIHEIIVRVHSETGLPSRPELRFTPTSGFVGMGSTLHGPTDKQSYSTLIRTIACPPDARQMTVEVGVADGEWRSKLSFDRHQNQRQFGMSHIGGSDGSWEGSVRTTNTSGETVPLAFSYSHRDDYETRLVYERADGTIIRMPEEGSGGGTGVINSITTLPVAEFESIRKFHVQARRYQWVEFRNVSLQLGHRTKVEVQSAR